MGEKTGRKPMYKTPDDMQKKIDEYFQSREGEPITDESGEPLSDKWGHIRYRKEPRPPTITGLALYLGFASRQALINYQVKPMFHDTITRAKTRVEEYAEERLYDRDGQKGAEFNLRVNFGWREPEEESGLTEPTRIIDDV